MLLTISWALLHTDFWSETQIIDTPVYERYGEAILDGQVPYRDFDLEYPPAASRHSCSPPSHRRTTTTPCSRC